MYAAKPNGISNEQNTSALHRKDRHFFGMKRQGFFPQQDMSDDYEQRFSEDRYGEESGPNARVWRTYLVESAEFDENMIGEARDGLDALLAGLFSAVVTSFLVQTSESLQPDFTEISASLLFELVAVQRAAADGSSVSTVPASPLNRNMIFTPDVHDVWVNGLWIVSLSLALVVALAAVLVKQWLHRYLKMQSGSVGQRSHIRHFRFIGYEKWQVQGIIGCLPVIMHLSLALFFCGLILFLLPLQFVLGCIMGVITFIVYMLYLVTNILPIFDPQCPYQTPLSDFLLILTPSARSMARKIRTICLSLRTRTFGSEHQPSLSKGFKAPERYAVDSMYDSLSVKALRWLYTFSSNYSVHSVVLQGIAGLPISVRDEVNVAFPHEDVQPVHERLLSTYMSRLRAGEAGVGPTIERFRRAFLFFPIHTGQLYDAVPSQSEHDVQLRATSLAVCKFNVNDDVELQDMQFVTSHCDTLLLHPLVWAKLLHKLFQKRDFYLLKNRTGEEVAAIEASLCIMSLQAIWGSPCPSSDVLSTMTAAIQSPALHDEICIALVNALASHNEHDKTLSLVTSAMIAIMRWALHHVCRDPENLTNVYWGIIDSVFDKHRIDAARIPQLFQKASWMNFLSAGFVDHLINKTDICDSPDQARPNSETQAISKHRAVVLKVYAKTRYWLLDRNLSRHRPDGSEFASLQRAITGTIRDIQCMILEQPVMSYNSILLTVLDILSVALEAGSRDAYDFVITHNLFDLLLKYQGSPAGLPPLTPHELIIFYGSYIRGLGKMRHCRDVFVDYLLHKPQNLHCAILCTPAVFRGSKRSVIDYQTDRVRSIVELRPLGPEDTFSWKECYLWVERVKQWVTGASQFANDGSSISLSKSESLKTFVDSGLGDQWAGNWLWYHVSAYGPRYFDRAMLSMDVAIGNQVSDWHELTRRRASGQAP